MKERPIIFSTEMVKAILEGQKTKTRRPIKPRKPFLLQCLYYGIHPGGGYWGSDVDPFTNNIPFADDHGFYCPYGQVGDGLWVRETWNYLVARPVWFGPGEDDWDYDSEECDYIPKAQDNTAGTICYYADDRDQCKWWRPSIHMPRWASRIDLEITDIRVEPLREINEVDAIAEGCSLPEEYSELLKTMFKQPHRQVFIDMWNELFGKKYPWDTNPWVWVIEFKRIKP
jgi:hypothetical protein